MVKSKAPAAYDPPPDTSVWVVTCEGALPDTLTETVMPGYAEPPLRASLRVQLPLPHDHPEPDMLLSVNPVGRVSLTVTVPLVGPAPAPLLTVNV